MCELIESATMSSNWAHIETPIIELLERIFHFPTFRKTFESKIAAKSSVDQPRGKFLCVFYFPDIFLLKILLFLRILKKKTQYYNEK